jgi:large subunit ribosomal protein L9
MDLLLLETVENLGIVGDIVKVRSGYGRNFLLPHGLAVPPTPTKIEALKEQRAAAQASLAALRNAREELVARMQEVNVTLVRSCNARGVLYGSVTQRDIADGLQEAGYDVGVRSVRLPTSIRRIGAYPVPVQFEKDLRCEITVTVDPDQPLDEREEMEFDNEGNLIERPAPKPDRKEKKEDEVKGEAPESKDAPAESTA